MLGKPLVEGCEHILSECAFMLPYHGEDATCPCLPTCYGCLSLFIHLLGRFNHFDVAELECGIILGGGKGRFVGAGLHVCVFFESHFPTSLRRDGFGFLGEERRGRFLQSGSPVGGGGLASSHLAPLVGIHERSEHLLDEIGVLGLLLQLGLGFILLSLGC